MIKRPKVGPKVVCFPEKHPAQPESLLVMAMKGYKSESVWYSNNSLLFVSKWIKSYYQEYLQTGFGELCFKRAW